MLGGWMDVEHWVFSSHVPAAVSGTWHRTQISVDFLVTVTAVHCTQVQILEHFVPTEVLWASVVPIIFPLALLPHCHCNGEDQSGVLSAWVKMVWIGFWMLAVGFSFVFNFTTITTLFLKQHLGGLCFLWCCFGLVNTLQSRYRCVGKGMFSYWPLMACIAASLQFRLCWIIVPPDKKRFSYIYLTPDTLLSLLVI